MGAVQPPPGWHRAVQQPLASGWLPTSCRALRALGLRLWLWKGMPHPHLQDWAIPGSNKPLSRCGQGSPSLIPSLSMIIRWLQLGVWAAAGFAGAAGQSSKGQAPARPTEEPGAMRVAVGILWLLALGGPPQARGACPSQCSCSLHVLGDGSKARYGTRCAGGGLPSLPGSTS